MRSVRAKGFNSQYVIKAAIGAVLASSMHMAVADYPTKPITMIVPFPAGGSTDLMARATAIEFSEALGKNVVVSNIGGGGGTVGAASIARSRADGYTIGVVPAAVLVNQPHMRATPYQLDSFEYVCRLFSVPLALAVKPGSPFKTLNQLIEYSKANPNTLTYGSPGPGSLPHLAMEQFLDKVGIQVKHVPFQGDAPGVTALIGGHIDLYMAIGNVVFDKELEALAVFDDQRFGSLPNLPTATEQGVDQSNAWWGGVIVPKGAPAEAKEQLGKACAAASQSARYAHSLTKLGTSVDYLGAAEFRQLVDGESTINGQLVEKVLKSGQGK